MTPAPPTYDFVCEVRMEFKERVRFLPGTPKGTRNWVPPASGTVSGPRLNGRIVPYSGGDWALGRNDGVLELEAHYMIEADDGTPIYIHNTGYLYGRQENGQPVSLAERERRGFVVYPSTYFCCTPKFDAPTGPHEWLTRTVLIGTGQRFMNPDYTLFRYFAVEM